MSVAFFLNSDGHLVLALVCFLLKLAVEVAYLLLVKFELSFKFKHFLGILPLFFVEDLAFVLISFESLIFLPNPVVVSGHCLVGTLSSIKGAFFGKQQLL